MSRWNWCTTENQAHSETEFLTCQTKLPANYPQGRHSLYACLLTTVFVNSETLCTVVMHVSCCLSTIPVTNMWWCCFCKSKEKLPWVNRCGPFSYKMQINIAQHCFYIPPYPWHDLFGTAVVKDYSLRLEFFPTFASGSTDGIHVLAPRWEQGFPGGLGDVEGSYCLLLICPLPDGSSWGHVGLALAYY